MITTIAKFIGVPEWLVVVAGIFLLSGAAGLAKCAYDSRVISNHETKQENKQLKREKKADANLETRKDQQAETKAQRKEEMKNATKGIPDRAPSERQRAIACSELRREAKQRGAPQPAC